MPRYAPVMSLDDFKDTIKAYAEFKDFDNEYDVEDYDDLENVIATGFMNAAFSAAWDDVRKIQVDFENVYIEQFVTLTNGVPIALVEAGGDWEVPVMFAFYFDGKKFRAYVPTDGNVYNRTLKQAYGNADEDEDNADALKYHGVEQYNQVKHDIIKCVADITARIEARGQSGAVSFGKNPAVERRKHLAATEPDLTVLESIPPEMVMARVMPAADGSYFTLNLRHSGRELNKTECDKVTVPSYFRRVESFYDNSYTWYGPDGMSSRQMAEAMIKEGFAIDPDSYLDDYRVRIIRL